VPPKIGDLVPANILAGEETDGTPAGLSRRYRLRGVGLVPMYLVYDPSELTEFCRSEDTCWGAEIIEAPAGCPVR